jgi:hypothetical protein
MNKMMSKLPIVMSLWADLSLQACQDNTGVLCTVPEWSAEINNHENKSNACNWMDFYVEDKFYQFYSAEDRSTGVWLDDVRWTYKGFGPYLDDEINLTLGTDFGQPVRSSVTLENRMTLFKHASDGNFEGFHHCDRDNNCVYYGDAIWSGLYLVPLTKNLIGVSLCLGTG